MGHFICKAAGEAVHRALRRVHRHVEFFALHPVGHQRPDADLAIARNELDPGAALDSALGRERRGDFHEGIRRLFANARTPVSQIAFVEMFEQPAIIQMQIKFLIHRVAWP